MAYASSIKPVESKSGQDVGFALGIGNHLRAAAGFAILFWMLGIWRATADEDGHYCFAVAL